MSKKPVQYMIALLLAALLLSGFSVTVMAAEAGGEITEPTPEPTAEPTAEPTPEPTPQPTAEPTPTPAPTVPPAAAAPVITADLPGSVAVPVGESFALSVGATGDNLSYQWYKDGEPLVGHSGPTLQVNGASATHSGRYYCYVQNSAGAVESNGCTVKVVSQPVITQDISPTALTLNAGDTITLTAAASGENMVIHWFYKKGDTELREIAGQNGTTLSITAAQEHNGADFYCQFVNEAGGAITSFCRVTVNNGASQPPKTTKDPVGEVVKERGSAIFIARADGAASYTWRFISSGGGAYDYNNLGSMFPGLNVSGGDTESLSLSNIPYELNGWKVACLFKNTAGETLSGSASIQVQRAGAAVSITSQPRGATMAMDEDLDFVLSVQASATNGGTFSYQWYSAPTNSASAMKSIPGATGSTYQPERIEGTTYYRVSVTVTSGGVTTEPIYSATVPVSFTTKKDHEHTYSSVWEHNDLSHWHQCTCGDHADEALHSYQWTVLQTPTETADGQQKGVCAVCGYETVQPIPAGSMPVATATPTPAPSRGGHAGVFILIGVLALGIIAAAVFLIMRVLHAPEDGEPEEEYDESGDDDDTRVFEELNGREEEEESRRSLRRWFRK